MVDASLSRATHIPEPIGPEHPSARAPIGLFDSGIGGTTVLREVHRLLPGEPLLYLADQARCPYGPLDVETLRTYAHDDTEWLLSHKCKLIVVACNTVSAAALYWLRERFPRVPFVGMVPALKPAAQSTKTRVVGVLATPATMQGQLLRDVLDRWAVGIRVIEQVAPGLVEVIEAGQVKHPDTRALLQSYLAPILAAGADTIVLGCTHYPYLVPLIRELAPQLRIVDAAPAVARQVQRLLHEYGLSYIPEATVEPDVPTPLHYVTTGDIVAFRRLLTMFEVPPGTAGKAEGHPALIC